MLFCYCLIAIEMILSQIKKMSKTFKIIAKLEGYSLLILLLFAMPMKYIFGQEIFVRVIGMTHGMLFIAYIFSAIYLKIEEKWNALKTTQIVLASVIPFGTFYIEKKYF